MSPFWYGLIGTLVGAAFVFVGMTLYGRRMIQRESGPRPGPSIELTGAEARAIDEKNPPHYSIYTPRSGESTLQCTCHQEMVPVGAKVLLWPIPLHPDGAVDVFCERTYGQVSP